MLENLVVTELFGDNLSCTYAVRKDLYFLTCLENLVVTKLFRDNLSCTYAVKKDLYFLPAKKIFKEASANLKHLLMPLYHCCRKL